MIYSIGQVISSVALMLDAEWPGVPVYGSPTAATRFPCFFVFLMPSTISDQIDKVDRRDISLDVVYVQQRDLPDAEAALWEIADRLDQILDVVWYTDGTEGTEMIPLHTQDRTYSIEDQELHYKLRIPARVHRPITEVLMQTMEENNVEVEG
jgi:hypothetical protein